MNAEYRNYTPENPDLIPSSRDEAQERLSSLLQFADLSSVDPEPFLEGWWSLFWLNPGLHPDDFEVWPDEFQFCVPLAVEAFRRASISEITDSQCYPAEAAHRRVWLERTGNSENHPDTAPCGA